MHSNALDYNEELDQIILSVRNFSEIWIIDHSTSTDEAASSSGGNSNKGGDLLFRWGNPAAYNKRDSSFQKCFMQHDAQWIDDFVDPQNSSYGNILFFNNNLRPVTSLGHTIAPQWDATSASYLQAQDGTFLPEDYDLEFTHPDTIRNYSSQASSIQMLDDGHVLFCAARPGRTFELDEEGKVVWEYLIPMVNGSPAVQGHILELSQNFTYQVKKYPPSYSAFESKDLTPKGYLELEPDTSFCRDIDTEVFHVPSTDKIVLSPNPVGNHKEIVLILLPNFEQDYFISDMLGRVVQKGMVSSERNTIDLKLNPGSYFIHLPKINRSEKFILLH